MRVEAAIAKRQPKPGCYKAWSTKRYSGHSVEVTGLHFRA